MTWVVSCVCVKLWGVAEAPMSIHDSCICRADGRYCMLSQWGTLPEDFLIGCLTTVVFGLSRWVFTLLLDGVTVLYMGQFSKCWSAAAVHSGWHLLYVRLYFLWLSTLTEHWNKYYLCLQAGSNYLQNHSKTTNLSSLVSWTCLVYMYLVHGSASQHPALHVSCLQKWSSKITLNRHKLSLGYFLPHWAHDLHHCRILGVSFYCNGEFFFISLSFLGINLTY